MIGGGICGKCGVQGHNKRTCGKTHNKIKTKSKPRICGKCGLQGHNKLTCGKEKHSVKSVKKAVKIKPNTKSFICEKCGHTNIGKPNR